MRRSALGSFAVAIAAWAVVSVDADAADLKVIRKAPASPLAAHYDWSGLYVGAGVGFRSVTADATVTGGTFGATSFATFCAQLAPLGGCVTSEPVNDTAFRFSPYVGYNWQIAARGIIGVEADGGFASRTTTLQGMRYPHTVEFAGTGEPSNFFSVKTGWDASLRARGGVLVDPAVLLYATAGIAWLHVESTSVCDTRPGSGTCRPPLFAPVVITDSQTKAGFTVGGGIEAMLWPNWIARAEYRYADFGTVSNTDIRSFAGTNRIVSFDIDLKTHSATFGLAYKFDGTGPAALGLAAKPAHLTPAPIAALWSGPYLGLDVGLRSTLADWTTTAVTDGASNCANLQPGSCFSQPLNGTAFRIGPHVGFNWQAAPLWIVGVEADVGWADNTTTITGMYYPLQIGSSVLTGRRADSLAVKTSWDASLRGRVGFLARPALLVYATGGAAWLHIEAISNCSSVPGQGECFPGGGFAFSPAVIAQATTKAGWTIGGGLEAMLWSNWLARGEYRYADFGTISTTDLRADPTGFFRTFSYDLRVRTHTAIFGLGYKFDPSWSVIAKY